MAGKEVDPIIVLLVDNSPNAGRYTKRSAAMAFLEEFGIKLPMQGFYSNFLPDDLLTVDDYESLYLTQYELENKGFQGIASANLMGLSSQAIMDEFIFNHPVFGKLLLL